MLYTDHLLGSCTLSCLFINHANSEPWFFTGVYCSGTTKRHTLWSELSQCRNKCGLNKVVGDDFNMVLRHCDKLGSQFSALCAQEFQNSIDNLDLEDLPLNGGQWIWSNQRDTPSFSRINRFFVSSDLLHFLSGIQQKVLPRPLPDHFPICLSSDGIRWGLVPFRIDNKWLKVESFRTMISNVWRETVIQGTMSYCFDS